MESTKQKPQNKPNKDTGGKDLRTDIQALRALAVASVVVYHLWPSRLSGGFVGVDVFFVISGFLITQHLLRDVALQTFSVLGFWARRIRRLLPASIAVLVVTAAGIYLVAPKSTWPAWISEVGASAAYFENWALASNTVDYLAAENAASPTQHFWSLSVEEQFYFVLPLLVLLVSFALQRKSSEFQRVVFVIFLALITSLSLAASVWLSVGDEGSAYFFTHVRAWQFTAGALLAALWARIRLGKQVRKLFLFAGFALILASAFLLDGSLAYPGAWALIPSIGALMVIAANLQSGWPPRLLAWRPIQFIGDISYSIYLWHWPLIILLPFVVGNLTTGHKLVIIGLTLLLAWLSRRFIEMPFITSGRRNRKSNAFTIGSMLAVCAGLLIGSTALSAQATEAIRTELAQEAEAVTRGIDCLGAATRAPDGIDCDNANLANQLFPAPDLASQDQQSALLPDGCLITKQSESKLNPCELAGQTGLRIALVGDSHAAQYVAPLTSIALKNHWQLVTYTKGGCPLSFAQRVHDADLTEACSSWVKQAVAELTSGEIDFVVTSQLSGVDWASGKLPEQEYAQSGLAKLWSALNRAGVPVLAIRDNPQPIQGALDCISKNAFKGYESCQNPQSAALLSDAQVGAAKLLGSGESQILDFTSVYCRNQKCDAVIGGVIVNRDSNHLTNTFARTLAPYIEARIKKMLALG